MGAFVVAAVAAGAVGGAAVGGLLPRLIRALPDREPHPDDPRPRAHREIGSARRLPWLTAAALAFGWAAIVMTRHDHPADIAAYLVVTAAWVALAVVDVADQRLPDLLTLPAAALGAVLLTIAAIATGEWGSLGRAAMGAVALTAFYLIFALLAPGNLGMGDVKLSLSIGLLLAWIGWPVLVAGTFLGFVAGGVLGLALMVSGRARWRSAIPFGPSMMLGALLGIGWGQVLAGAYGAF